MAIFASSYIPTSGATATRAADALTQPFLFRPQAMTLYVRFIELGTSLVPGARIWQISNAAAATPRLLLSHSINYLLQHGTGTGSVNAETASLPTIGQSVELLSQISGTGAVKLIQSIDGAAATETAESSALVFATEWSGTSLHINDSGTGTARGFIALRNFEIHRGVQTLATMRRQANVI